MQLNCLLLYHVYWNAFDFLVRFFLIMIWPHRGIKVPHQMCQSRSEVPLFKFTRPCNWSGQWQAGFSPSPPHLSLTVPMPHPHPFQAATQWGWPLVIGLMSNEVRNVTPTLVPTICIWSVGRRTVYPRLVRPRTHTMWCIYCERRYLKFAFYV